MECEWIYNVDGYIHKYFLILYIRAIDRIGVSFPLKKKRVKLEDHCGVFGTVTFLVYKFITINLIWLRNDLISFTLKE